MGFKNKKQQAAVMMQYNKRGRLTTRGSGEGRVMNKGLQVYNIKRELQLEGIDPDTVDVESEVDMNLRYMENLNKIITKAERDQERCHNE